jgi:lysophosphatidylglycerol acyltransferase 1
MILIISKCRYIRKNEAEIGFSSLEHVTLPRIGAMEAIMETLAPPSVQPNEAQTYQSGNEDLVPNHIIIPSAEEPCLKYVLDITIAYPNKNPLGLFDIVTGFREPMETYFFYRIFDTKSVSCTTTSTFKVNIAVK